MDESTPFSSMLVGYFRLFIAATACSSERLPPEDG